MKEVNGLPVYEENDICALDKYSETMAQKVHEKVESAKYDDTEVKGDIEEIHGTNEEQYKEIATLRNSVINLKDYMDNMLPNGQASGEDITINDSAKYPCVVEVSGNSWQETRTGKNKFDYKNANIKANSYINVNTGEITTTSNTNYATENYIEIEQQNYSIPAATSNFRLAFYSAEKVFISSKNSNFINFEVPEDAKYIRFSDTNLSNIMLLEGNTEDTEYEEYGASPSTAYPSSLEAVGDRGSLKVTASNKNLCYESRVQNYSNIRFYFNPRLITKSFVISFIVNSDLNSNSLYLNYGGSENPRVAQITAAANTKVVQSITLTDSVYNALENSKAAYFLLYKGNAGFTEVKEAIIVNSTDTSATYIAHEEQNAIFPFSEGQRLLKNCKLGDTEIIQNRKKIVLDGSENWVFGNKRTKTINFLLNDFSGYANTGSNSANAICTHFKGKENGADIDEACFWFNGTGGFRIRIEIDELADVSTNEKCVESFKSYLAQQYSTGTPVELEYELAEPETAAYTEAQKTAKAEIDKLKTYKGVTYITTDSRAILDVSYKKDLEILINNLSNAGEG